MKKNYLILCLLVLGSLMFLYSCEAESQSTKRAKINLGDYGTVGNVKIVVSKISKEEIQLSGYYRDSVPIIYMTRDLHKNSKVKFFEGNTYRYWLYIHDWKEGNYVDIELLGSIERKDRPYCDECYGKSKDAMIR